MHLSLDYCLIHVQGDCHPLAHVLCSIQSAEFEGVDVTRTVPERGVGWVQGRGQEKAGEVGQGKKFLKLPSELRSSLGQGIPMKRSGRKKNKNGTGKVPVPSPSPLLDGEGERPGRRRGQAGRSAGAFPCSVFVLLASAPLSIGINYCL